MSFPSYTPISDASSPSSPSSNDTDLFSGSSGSATPNSTPSKVMDEPQRRHEAFELDLSFNDMDLVPYISPSGEYKEWDRNDPDDYEAEEECKLCGSDKEREDAVEAWRAVRSREVAREEADAKTAAEKEEDEWYAEMFGMTAAQWAAKSAMEKAVNEQAVKEAEANAPSTDTFAPSPGRTAPETEVQTHNDLDHLEAGDEDDGASLQDTNPEVPPETSGLNSDPTEAPLPHLSQTHSLTVKELFALKRRQRNKAKRAAKKLAQSQGSTSKPSIPATKTAAPKTVIPGKKEKTVQAPSTSTDTTSGTTKAKRVYKPRAKKTVQAPNPVPDTAPDTHSSPPVTDQNEDDATFEAELWAALEAEEAAERGASLADEGGQASTTTTGAPASDTHIGSNEDDDGLEAELWAALEAEEAAERGSPLSHEGGNSTTCHPASHTAKPDDQRVSRSPPPTIGKGGVAKKKKTTKKASAETRARNWATLHPQQTTSLDQAVVHLHSKPAEKAREIFIDTALSSVVLHGRKGSEDVTMTNGHSDLPKLYHVYWKSGPNYRLLSKHMDLRTDVKLSEVYTSLGLDLWRGKAIFTQIQKLLKTPGCSLRIHGDLVEEHKILVGERAHKLLAIVGWGQEHFQRPALSGRDSKDKQFDKVSWSNASTEIFLGFSKLLYAAAKMDEARRKGLNRRTQPAEPAVPEPAEQPQSSPPAPSPPAPTAPMPMPMPTPTAIHPAAVPLPRYASTTGPAKRSHDLIDLTGDDDEVEEVGPSPNKRARLSGQAARPQHSRAEMEQNQQSPPQPRARIQESQRPQQDSPVLHQYQGQQHTRALPHNQDLQRLIVQNQQHLQNHQTQAQYDRRFRSPQRLPAHNLQGRSPQAWPQHQGPHHLPAQNQQAQNQQAQVQQSQQSQQSQQIPQTLPKHQSRQSPWAHLQTRHSSPPLLRAQFQQPLMQPQFHTQAYTDCQNLQRPRPQRLEIQAQQPMGLFLQAGHR